MDGWITIGTKLDTKNFDKQIKDLENDLQKAEKEIEEFDLLDWNKNDDGYTQAIKKVEKLKQEIVQVKKEQAALNDQSKTYNVNIEDIKNNIKNIDGSIAKVVKKVGKWGLAVFGVRSAYMFVRQSISTLSQYNEQLATDIEFIRYAVASTLEPVIEIIVNLVYKLLSLLNAIWTRLFGVSLFSENLAKNFKNAKNSANAMKKSLAGFDEMNILNSDGSTGIALSPSFDPSKADADINNWLDNLITKVKNFGQSILNLIPNYLKEGISLLWKGLVDEIAGIILIIKGLFTGSIEDINAGIGNFVKGAGEILNGLVTIAGGVVNSIIRFFGRIGAGLWNGLKQGARDTFNGIKSLFGQLPNWFKALIKGIVNSAISMINGLISGLNSLLTPLRSLIATIGKVMGYDWSLSNVRIPKIPRLAKGGIVNMPSRGVPVGGAIAGERGQEGVIPLTDSQQMALLGEAIGKYITINATVVNSMNGRVLSREIQKIQNQGNFAMNR